MSHARTGRWARIADVVAWPMALAGTAVIGMAAPAPPASAQAAAYDRAIPNFPRPPGSPDPARRVRLLQGAEAPPLLTRIGAQTEPLFRRLADGSYAVIQAPRWQAVDTGCPARYGGGDPRSRMIDLAAAEWAYFGLPVLDLSAAPSTAVPRGSGQSSTTSSDTSAFDIIDPSRNFSTGRRATRSALRLGLMEDDAQVDASIAGYWAVVPGGDDALRVQSLVRFGSRDAGWAMPWSAAFVSWLACEAGFSSAQFRRSASHFDYVSAAVQARDGLDADHAFVAYDLGETTPRAGDLICTARAGSTFRSIADVRDQNSDSQALHCDLVVKTDPAAHRLYAIGGNVAQAVTLSVIATDAGGRPLNDALLPGSNRWFAILKPRIAGAPVPGLDRTPTVLSLFQAWRRYAEATGTPAPTPLKTP
ncbi:MAG TPA: DUF2272 domain-containing protein [Lysobacter sp.]|nr:DUF2272 domain-containing protein [Lysobacter sp.]